MPCGMPLQKGGRTSRKHLVILVTQTHTSAIAFAKLLCYQLNIPLSQIKKKQAATPQSAASGSYTARIDVSGGKSLNMSLYFGDEKICEAYSKIKGPGKLDLMQAISYAAHMMYKIAEQEELKKRK